MTNGEYWAAKDALRKDVAAAQELFDRYKVSVYYRSEDPIYTIPGVTGEVYEENLPEYFVERFTEEHAEYLRIVKKMKEKLATQEKEVQNTKLALSELEKE